MIQFRNLKLARGARVLIDEASLTLHDGEKIGLVGANGCGKSSLFALLRGELHAEAGDADLPRNLRIAHLAQDTPALPAAAIEHVLDGDDELRAIEREIAAGADGAHLAELHGRYDHIGGYGARARAAELMAGLGFRVTDHARAVAEFSGGWRVRLNLARALMARADLLLLDEPTNHLDLEAVLWLEQWLRSYRGTLVLISHDREFLDAVTGRILHIVNQRLRSYSGNYSAFEGQRAAQLAQQQAAADKQRREIAHMASFVERFRAKATKARQAQSRLKALARMTEIAPAHVDSPFAFEFPVPQCQPDPALVLEDVTVGYGGAPILSDIRLTLRAGERLALLGPNGAGKSTLVKLLAGHSAPASGSRREGKGLAVGYFAQHQLEQLREDESPLAHLIRLEPASREQDLRDYLGGFGFAGDAALAAVGPMSGGEKARLALALIVRARPNLLLLDEPTNHLDIEMRHALTEALLGFEGTLVLVSHDRHLLRTCADRLLLVADARVQPFDGDLDDYRDWLAGRRTPAAEAKDAEPAVSRKDQRRADAQARDALNAKLRPVKQRIEQVERELAQAAVELARIDAELADQTLYQSTARERLQQLLQRQGELRRAHDAGEEQWLELHAQLEALEAQ